MLFDTGHNRKTDALDAHSIAIVAVRTKGLRVLAPDGELGALRMLADRRDELSHLRGDAGVGSPGHLNGSAFATKVARISSSNDDNRDAWR